MTTERRPKILVVDDDAAITTTFQNILEGEGYEVTTATDGIRAIELARREAFDLVMLDMIMPRMDGLVTLRGLREVAPSARVVILSAFIEREREAEALRLGAKAVLAKPPELQKLLRFLHETLRRDDPSGNSPSPQASRASWTR